MAFLNWLIARKGGKQRIRICKVQEESIEMGSMASCQPASGVAAIRRMMDRKNSLTKILVVGNGAFTDQLADYSLKMAQRLDCAIVALNVTDSALLYSGQKQEEKIALFYEASEKNIKQYMEKADAMGVKVVHIMEVGDQERAISQLSAQDAGIRYVLTEPEYQGEDCRGQIPVFDLAYSSL